MRQLFVIVFLVIITVFVGSAWAEENEVVAKIGSKKITVSDFNRIIGYFDPQRQQLLESNQQLKETFLKQMIQSMVIAEIAKKEDFDKDPAMNEKWQFYKDSFLANEYLRSKIATQVSVQEEDVKKYYETHRDEFKTPEMVRASHILIRADKNSSEEDKKKAKEKAEELLKKIKSGEDFAKLASEFSDDPGSKTKGGDLGFFQKGRMIKPFEEAAFALKPGEVSGIVETQFGYHIIKVEERKEASIEPYEKVKESIQNDLLQERTRTKVNEFIEKAMKDANVEMYPEVIAGEKK